MRTSAGSRRRRSTAVTEYWHPTGSGRCPVEHAFLGPQVGNEVRVQERRELINGGADLAVFPPGLLKRADPHGQLLREPRVIDDDPSWREVLAGDAHGWRPSVVPAASPGSGRRVTCTRHRPGPSCREAKPEPPGLWPPTRPNG